MPGPSTPAEGPTEPQIRLGLVVGAPVATVSGTAGLSVSDPSGARLAEIPAAWIDPATPVFHPPEPRGRTSRFLFGSGGERTAFLGTARL